MKQKIMKKLLFLILLTIGFSQQGALQENRIAIDLNTLKVTSQWTTNGSDIYYNTGNVGIGTSTPISALEVESGLTTTGAVFSLGTKETTVVDGDKLGQIDFYAPLEASGTDAILPGASIWAEADSTFEADDNSTSLIFATGSSGSATEQMRLNSDGTLDIVSHSMMPYFDVYQTEDSGQTGIVSGVTTQLEWTEEREDSHNDFASNKFTPSREGWYQLYASYKIEGTTIHDAEWWMISIRKNGTATISGTATASADGGNLVDCKADDFLYANGTTDYFDVEVYQLTGANADIYMTGNTSYRHTYFKGYGLGH